MSKEFKQALAIKIHYAQRLFEKTHYTSPLYRYHSGYLVGLKEAWLIRYGTTRGMESFIEEEETDEVGYRVDAR